MIERLELPELEFDAEKHRYLLNGSLVLPSVTQVISPLTGMVYGGTNSEVLNKAAARGTAVHEAIENYCVYGIEDIEPENAGYFKAFLKWYQSHKFESVQNEIRIYHKIMLYAGTIDMLAEIDGEKCLIDFKTSATVQRKLCAIQLEAYKRAWETHTNDRLHKIIVHLRSDGGFGEIHFTENDKPWDAWGALLTLRAYMDDGTRIN